MHNPKEIMLTIYFAKVKQNAIVPTKRDEDAGYDLYLCLESSIMVLQPHETKAFPLGIASAFPSDYYFQLQERSSTGKLGLSLRAGVVDSGYRGEWIITLSNLNEYPIYFTNPEYDFPLANEDLKGITYCTNKAIAQAVLLPVPKTSIIELSYNELLNKPSKRMTSAFGSTNRTIEKNNILH